jgi:heptaprenylglyceryl phosphate synthase
LHSLLSAHGEFTFPEPQRWPAETLRAFGKATGERSLLDIFIFDHGHAMAMYMEDAVTALAVLPITRDEWFTHAGYPAVVFDPPKLERYREQLQAAGYRVVVLEKASEVETRGNGKVISIASARTVSARRRHKWA